MELQLLHNKLPETILAKAYELCEYLGDLDFYDKYKSSPKIMKNVEYLLDSNRCQNKYARKHLKKGDKQWTYELKDCTFDSIKIKNFIYAVNWIKKFKPMPLVIKFSNVKFKDKLVMSILECICYYLIEYKEIDVFLKINIKKTIITNGIDYSALLAKNPPEFKKLFSNVTTKNHFRRVISFSHHKTSFLSKCSSEIYNFFKNYDIDAETTTELSETLSEVIGNAIEHGKSDCFIDIDITKPECMIEYYDKSFSINVVVINFSDVSFYTKLKKKLEEPLTWDSETKQRYYKVLEAKEFHEKHFDENYTIKDFYTIASFQKGISGDIRKEGNGGFGLSQLIQAIEQKSFEDYCYMLSEKRVIIFKKEFIHCDSENFIGFNAKNDFFTELPDQSVMDRCDTFFPGVAYNFNFIIKSEED